MAKTMDDLLREVVDHYREKTIRIVRMVIWIAGIIIALLVALLHMFVCGYSDVSTKRDAALATADSLLVVTRKQAVVIANSDSIIALLQRQSAARLDTITALRREHSARVYPKRRAQLDSLTSPLTATPDDVRAWLKQ